jgi:4-amino-4-deoxy-L-arabinose transferase-like glycosyltransferase
MHLCLGPGKNPFPVINRDGHLVRPFSIPFITPTANHESQPASGQIARCELSRERPYPCRTAIRLSLTAVVHCRERNLLIESNLNVANYPVQLWIAVAVFLACFWGLVLTLVRFIWSLPRAQRQTLAKVVLVVIFFPLIFLFLMCRTDPDD